VIYTIHDAYNNYSNDGSVIEEAANSDIVSHETFSHELIRYTIVILDPGILVLDRFSAHPDTVANELFNERLRVLTLLINFCLYFCIGYLVSLIVAFFKPRRKSAITP
jgi:hypothetical protein